MISLAIANQKGGVGKSTLTVHLAHAAMEAGLKVLLVDMDSQGNLTMSFPCEANPSFLAASDLFLPVDKKSNKFPLPIDGNSSIIKADMGLLAVDKAENQVIHLPRDHLKRYAKDYDLCLVDTPPLLGVRLMASLSAVNFVVTPFSVGVFELAGFADLIQTIHVIKTQGFNPLLKHIGIVAMRTNSRSSMEQEVLDSLRVKYGEAVFTDTLPERAAVREAVASRRPVWQSVSGGSHIKAAKEWKKVCNLILQKIGVAHG